MNNDSSRLVFLVTYSFSLSLSLENPSIVDFFKFVSPNLNTIPTSRAGFVSRSPTDESGWQSRDETYVFASLVPNFSIFFSPSSVALCAIAFIRIDVTFWFDYRYTGTV